MTDTDPIVFITAMPREMTPLIRRLRLTRDTVGGVPVHTGSLDGVPVVALVSGMGTVLAAAQTERLLAVLAPRRVVVVGIAGSVDDSPLGALVRPALVVGAATGKEHRPELLGAGPHRGTMWTTDRVTTPAEIPDLLARGVVSLDMETAAIAGSCEQRGVPWSVFRCTTDHAEDGHATEELFALTNQDGTTNPGRVVRYLLRHPLQIPALARLGRATTAAGRTAADAAIDAARADA